MSQRDIGTRPSLEHHVHDEALPHGWANSTIDGLASNEPGAITDGPFGSNLKSEHYTDAGPRVIRLQNIGEGVFLDAKAHVSELHFESLRKHEARAGDVVVAMLGDDLPRACLVPESVGPAIVKADCVRLRVHPQLNAALVAAGLNSHSLRRQAAELMHGVGRPRLGLQWFRGLTFPVPPMPEQERIVDAIDSYSTRLDDAVATLQRVERNLERYRASVLKAAVEGRLAPTEASLAKQDGRDYEPASVLLERILTERRRRWAESGKRGKYQEPTPPDTSKLPELPEGWCWATLAHLIGSLDQGWSPRCERDGVPSEAQWVVMKTTAVQHLEYRDTEHKALPVDLSPREHLELATGDLLVTRAGPRTRVGVCCLVRATRPRILLCDKVYRLRAAALIPPEFLELALNSPLLLDAIERQKTGISDSGVNLTQENFVQIPVPLPPVAEQRRIVEELERQWTIVAALRKQQVPVELRCQRLRQAILKWAFEGKLADQDPADEPASELLARIQAERASTTPARAARSPRTSAKKRQTA